MTNWKGVNANSNLIQAQSATSYLIKLPKSDYQFWHSAKCVRLSGKNNYRLEIRFTDEHQFKIFKPGKGKYNKHERIDARVIDAQEFEGFFVKDQDDDACEG